MKMKILFALLSFFCACSFTFAQQNLQESKQMVLVTSSDWNSIHGTLQRYERNSAKQKWKKVGTAIPVVLGRNGMAWGVDVEHPDSDAVKKEGDGRTPAGIYEIGPGFGFADKSIGKLDYFPLTDTSVCVDDTKSNYYNQLIDSAKIPTVDWNSGEQMHQVPGYEMGSMIQYNTENPVRGAGSCIFMHIWKGADVGTAGCIAMEATNLKPVLQWLNSRKKPMMVLITMPAYEKVKSEWKLPSL
jgi:D-alanyl-D-alanine dipeptidase